MEFPGWREKRGKRFTASVIFLVGLSLCGLSYASGAKALFYDEGDVSIRADAAKPAPKKSKPSRRKKTPSSESYLGISYWIDLVDGEGKVTRTNTSRIFRSGDRIKLNLQSNRSGYLYVLGVGSSGISRVLFPNYDGAANGIKAKATYAVPFETNLRFDDTPGEETLLVLLSQRPIPSIAAGRKTVPEQETRKLVAAAHVPGAKDLVLEEELPETAIAPATYAVVPVAALGEKGILSVRIKLRHQ